MQLNSRSGLHVFEHASALAIRRSQLGAFIMFHLKFPPYWFPKKQYFTNGVFPTTALNHVDIKGHGKQSFIRTYFTSYTSIGVNVGQAIKSEAVAFRYSHDSTDLDSTRNRIAMIEQYHGRSSGIFGADEHLAGLMPSRGSELVSRIAGLSTYAFQRTDWDVSAWLWNPCIPTNMFIRCSETTSMLTWLRSWLSMVLMSSFIRMDSHHSHSSTWYSVTRCLGTSVSPAE